MFWLGFPTSHPVSTVSIQLTTAWPLTWFCVTLGFFCVDVFGVKHWPLVRSARSVWPWSGSKHSVLRLAVCECVCVGLVWRKIVHVQAQGGCSRMSRPEIVSKRPNILPLPPYDSTAGFPSHLRGTIVSALSSGKLSRSLILDQCESTDDYLKWCGWTG